MRIVILLLLLAGSVSLRGQSLSGLWEEVSGPSCPVTETLFSHVHANDEEGAHYGLLFADDKSGMEGIRYPGHVKLRDTRKILYRQQDDNLYILNPRERIIEGTYLITSLSADSLVIVNPHNPCEQFSFAKVRP